MMVQPFEPSIRTHGELSFILIDDQLSHALTKHPRPGEYRIQSIYGPTCRTSGSALAEIIDYNLRIGCRGYGIHLP